jgi:NAD/NADP transhydrogenase alpha subunit
MRSAPGARIALIGNPLLQKQLQGIEARRMRKSCHETSEDSSCARERRQACETSARGYERQHRAHGHDVVLTSALHCGKPARQLEVEEELAMLPPVVAAIPQPPAPGSRR